MRATAAKALLGTSFRRGWAAKLRNDGYDASVDYVEIGTDKTRRVHCGPASGGPYVSTSGPSLTLGAPRAGDGVVAGRSGGSGHAAT